MPERLQLIGYDCELPKAVVEQLKELPADRLLQVVILLPTQRLQSYVLLELAREQEACTLPRLMTLQQFLAAFADSEERRLLRDTEQVVIINTLLRKGDYFHLRPGMENDLVRVFNELAENASGAEAFPHLYAQIQQDIFRDEAHLQKLTEQVQELEACYRAYLELLDQHKLIDGAHDFLRRTQALEVDRLRRFERILIAGFSDATAAQALLLQKIAGLPQSVFLFYADAVTLSQAIADPSAPLPYRPLLALLERMGWLDEFSRLQKGTADDTPANAAVLRAAFQRPQAFESLPSANITVHTANSLIDEVKCAAAHIRRSVLVNNVALTDIAVIVPDEVQYGSLIRAVFSEAGIPMDNSLGFMATQTQIGQWLRLLLNLLLYDWRAIDLLAFTVNRITQFWLEQRAGDVKIVSLQNTLHRILKERSIHEGAGRLLAEIENLQQSTDGTGEFAELDTVHTFITALMDELQVFLSHSRRPLHEWGQLLWECATHFQADAMVMTGEAEQRRCEWTVFRAFSELMQQLQLLSPLFTERQSLREFAHILWLDLFGRPHHVHTRAFRGVQVLGLLEGRGLPFRVAMVLGNYEGCFPGTRHTDFLIPETFRRRLGLTTQEKLEKLQDQLFFSLCAGIPEVHLFCPRFIGDQPAVQSRYLLRLFLLQKFHPQTIRSREDRGVLFPGDRLVEPAWLHAQPEWATEREAVAAAINRRRGAQGDFQGNRKQLFARMSASSLEHLLHCPFRYLLEKLQIAGSELPDDEMDAREAGEWLHRVCEHFFKGLQRRSDVDPGLQQSWKAPITEANAEAALERLRRLSRLLMDRDREKLDYLYQMHHVGWRLFIAREISRGLTDASASEYEYRLGRSAPSLIRMSDCEIAFTGRVDRIVPLENGFLVIDYKTRKRWQSKKQVTDGRLPQLPLYVHLLRQQARFQEASVRKAEYFALWSGDCLELQDEASDHDLGKSWQAIASLLERRIHDHLTAGKPFQPEEDKSQCRYCAYSGICRREEGSDWSKTPTIWDKVNDESKRKTEEA